MPALYPFLNAVDKGVVSVLHDLVVRKWEAPAVKINWSATLSSLVQLNETSRYLCQLNESGAAADVILYSLARAS